MKQVMFVVIAVLGCLAATRVSISLVPVVVGITLGVFMVLHGTLAARPDPTDPDLLRTQPLPRLRLG